MFDIDNVSKDNNWVLQIPIWIVEKSWRFIPVLNKEWNIETNRKAISTNVEAILTTVEPDVLSLINVWFKSHVWEVAQRVDILLEILHKQNTLN